MECLAFEDSENGIRASLGARLKTIITVNGYTRTHDFTGAVAVLSDLGEAETPCDFIQGANHGKSFVDLALLRAWHAE